MPFPSFNYCIVCEGVRAEIGGKLTILGFYGIAPDVDLLIVNINQPTVVSFLVGFPPVAESHRSFNAVLIISRPDGGVIFQTPPTQLQVSPSNKGVIGYNFLLPPNPIPGTYSLRILVNNEAKLETSFRVRAATSSELTGLGLSVPGRTN